MIDLFEKLIIKLQFVSNKIIHKTMQTLSELVKTLHEVSYHLLVFISVSRVINAPCPPFMCQKYNWLLPLVTLSDLILIKIFQLL